MSIPLKRRTVITPPPPHTPTPQTPPASPPTPPPSPPPPTRLQFKYALQQCRIAGEINREDALARSLHCKDTTSFWKGVNSIRDNNVLLATKVGGAFGKLLW